MSKIKKSSSNHLATKKDVRVLRSDFRTLRSEFKSTKKSIFDQMLKLEEKIENVEDRLSKKIDRVLTAVSSFAGRVETLETENEIGTDQIRRVREDVDKHERRIKVLESTA